MLYDSFVNHLTHDDEEESNTSALHSPPDAAKLSHLDTQFVDNKLRLRVNYIYANEVSAAMVDHFAKWQLDDDPPSAIVASCTHAGFYAGNLTDDTVQRIQTNLTRLVLPIDGLAAKKTKVLWKLQDDVDEESERLADDWKNVLNADIYRYNEAAADVLAYTDVHMWSSARAISAGLVAESQNGWRLSRLALQHDTQILLNMYCNDNMNYNDGTCCSSAEPYTILQIVTYSVFGVW